MLVIKFIDSLHFKVSQRLWVLPIHLHFFVVADIYILMLKFKKLMAKYYSIFA